jgi:hypothetical protein
LGPSGSKNPIIFIPYSELNNEEEYCQVIVPKVRYATAPSLNDEGILNRDDYENFYVKRQGGLGLEGDEEKETPPLAKKLVPGI